MPEDGRALIEAVYGEGSSYDVPEGLVNKVCMAIGKDSAKVGMAHLNALLLEKGYCRNAVRTEQWNEEDKIPTRLSEDNEEIVLVVLKDGELRPYADVDEFAWDWSTLSVSFGDWKRAAYVLAPVAQVLEEVLKIKYPRLKYCQIVQVQCHASAALSATASISEVYDPRLGWGVGLSKEA